MSQPTAPPRAPSIHLYSLFAQCRITFEDKTLSHLLLFIIGQYTLDIKLQTDYSKYIWEEIRGEVEYICVTQVEYFVVGYNEWLFTILIAYFVPNDSIIMN